jgi:hypothetical protein
MRRAVGEGTLKIPVNQMFVFVEGREARDFPSIVFGSLVLPETLRLNHHPSWHEIHLNTMLV